MDINKAIDVQIELLMAEIERARHVSYDNAKLMSVRFTIASLNGQLGEMIVARDDGRKTW